MQISAISRTASPSTESTPAQNLAASPSTALRQNTSAVQSSDSAGTASFVAQIQNSAGSTHKATIAASYSTTVGGRNYSASVQKSEGVYTASVPMPPGLSASGSSIESAEINLGIILDTLA